MRRTGKRGFDVLRFGTISRVTGGPAAAKHLRDLAWLRRGDMSVTEVRTAVGETPGALAP
jgi:hypothetical protein